MNSILMTRKKRVLLKYLIKISYKKLDTNWGKKVFLDQNNYRNFLALLIILNPNPYHTRYNLVSHSYNRGSFFFTCSE